MKLQNFTVIFIIIILPIILLVSLYISTGLKTIKYQALYDTGLITATQDAIQAFEINTTNNTYSDNAEVKRSVIKSSIKMLEKGLCNTCNISSYNTDEIEEYIPAVLFGMNNGFYLYTPSLNPETNKYEHSLKNYVYYSETLEGNNIDTNGVVIIYHLDSYVEVSGWFKREPTSDDTTTSKYESQEGYLINTSATKFYWDSSETITADNFYSKYKNALKSNPYNLNGSIKYYDTEIDIADELAVNYFVDNYKFSQWFNDTVYSNVKNCEWLYVDNTNDPEDPESDFSMHKKEVIRNKIQNVLNSSITAYSERTYGQEYKMPKLSEEDWEKIYTDISVITFFQGKKIGFTKYNGYCVLNSNNHNELINPNLLYFITDEGKKGTINTTDDYYHDIRCSELSEIETIKITQEDRKSIETIRGWKIGRFQRKTITQTNKETGEATYSHTYERKECACYECINGPVSNSGISIYDYINVATSSISKEGDAEALVTRSYWTSLARERAKLHEDKEIPTDITVTKKVKGIGEDSDGTPYVMNGDQATYTITIKNNADKIEYININDQCINTEDQINNITITKVMKDSSEIDITDITEITEITEIDKNQTITITYTATIVDGNNDEKVENKVEILIDGIVKAEAKATCKVYTQNVNITKIVDKSKVKYGDSVKFTINIYNYSKKQETINIKDIYNNNEIKIKNVTSDPNISEYKTVNGENGNGYSGNKSLEWNNINIAANSQIKIEITATITGNIGKEVINAAKVQLAVTGNTRWASTTTCCTVEKEVKTTFFNTATKKNVVLVFDTSNSMSWGSNDYNSYLNSAKNFIKNVNKNANLISGIIFNKNASKYSYEQLMGQVAEADIKTKGPNADWEHYWGTSYDSALKICNDIVGNENSSKIDLIIFFSDGKPTTGLTDTWGIGYNSVTKYLSPWREIMNYVKTFKDYGITIATVDYKSGGGDGLEEMASEKNDGTGKKHYYNSTSFTNLFDSVLSEAVGVGIEIPESYTSSEGIITLENPDRISNIKIDGVNLPNYRDYINEGKLDLNKIPGFKGSETVEIIYQ